MEIKAIVVDLDRTLLHTDKTISPYTVDVLMKCHAKGIKIMVATARPLRTTMEYLQLFPFDAVTVSNGARVLCGEKKKEYGISLSDTSHILDVLSKYPDIRITLETGDCAYSNLLIEEYETIMTDDLFSYAKREGVLKLLMHIDAANTLAVVKSSLTDNLYYTIAHESLIQIMNKSATKWNGIKQMLDFVGVQPKDTIYFGDDYDDLEPIEMCGIGIAVSNGIEEVKKKAEVIVESNDNDGVAKWLEANI